MRSASGSTMEALLRRSAVLPVVTIDDASIAVPLAEALYRGGLRSIEVTLRTPVALDAIARIARALPDLSIGAGTVRTPQDLAAAAEAGAAFAVSPGATDALYAARAPLPWLPAVATASELMRGLDAGHRCFKLFPAVAAGGVALLRALHAPFPDALFCPTGGITPGNAGDFLALPCVACVGGSWLAPPELLQRADWPAIEKLARAAAALRPMSGVTAR